MQYYEEFSLLLEYFPIRITTFEPFLTASFNILHIHMPYELFSEQSLLSKRLILTYSRIYDN